MRFIVLVPLLMALVAAFVSGMGISFKTLQMSIMGTVNASCSSSDLGPDFNCSGRTDDPYIANMSDCAAYVKCEGGTACGSRCTHQINNESNVYVFSTDTKTCVPYDNNICGSRTYVDPTSVNITDIESPTTAAPVTPAPLTNEDCRSTCGGRSGLLPLDDYRNPCGNWFCQCSYGYPYLQNCASNLGYNPRTCECDWQKLTYAQPPSNSTATTPPPAA